MSGYLPTDAKARKNAPMARGLLDYFPLACAAVAELSRIGNEQHNPGEPMHWAREKSTDHDDCIVRHLVDRGKIDTDGVRHRTKVAWRSLAALQLELEEALVPGDFIDKAVANAPYICPDIDGDVWCQPELADKYPPVKAGLTWEDLPSKNLDVGGPTMAPRQWGSRWDPVTGTWVPIWKEEG